MLVALRFAVPEAGADDFAERATVALGALAACPGYRRGDLGRAFDDPTVWCLLTEWESVGSYRRALGAYEVKLHATPLLAQALDEPSAFEPLASAPPGGPVAARESDRAPGQLRSRA
jgi:hypothetical protein